MEKFMLRENVHFGYGKPPKSPDSGDTDFNDVFGGPPRRFSMQEVRARYSFGESEEETASSQWKEKPVFGEDTTPGRRKGAGFFNDIFKGGDRDRDSVFESNSSSRTVSPKADSLATSLPPPAHFSLPARLSKGNDLPAFGSLNHGEKGNGLSSPQSWGALSRFSNGATGSMNDSNRNEVHPVYPHSPLSNEASFMTEKDTNNVDSIADQFHFSIYKWAGRGVPMLIMPQVIESEVSKGRMERKSPSVRRRGSSAAQGEVTSKEEQNHAHFSESESKSSPTDSFGVKEEPVKSVDDRNVGEKIEKQVPVKIREVFEPEVKPLHAFLVEVDQPSEILFNFPGKTKDGHDSTEVRKKGGDEVSLNNANSTGTPAKSAPSKGKVKEFIQVFNQEADVEGSRSSKQGKVGTDQKGINDVSSNLANVKQVNLHNEDKKQDVPFKVVENPKNDEAQQGFSSRRMRNRSTTRSFSTLRRSFSTGDQPHTDLKMSPENFDDPLEENFEVQELSDDYENFTQEESSVDTKAIDDKIRQWSVGKKGNIRSLLSTLQFVLWAESGWKAVPLVDLIEANSVKRTYQKALLRLHPDKLQQKGAAFHHKYIAEKVFDILQEAWDHFNTCSSLRI